VSISHDSCRHLFTARRHLVRVSMSPAVNGGNRRHQSFEVLQVNLRQGIAQNLFVLFLGLRRCGRTKRAGQVAVVIAF
jgi:hypothetical protein